MKKARAAMLLALSLMMTSATFASPGASPDQDQIDRGHKVYDKWCFPCHGTGVGKPGTDSTAPAIKQFVRHGVLFMPMFRKTEISDAELDAICAYLTRNNKP